MDYYKPIGKTTLELVNEIKEEKKLEKITKIYHLYVFRPHTTRYTKRN